MEYADVLIVNPARLASAHEIRKIFGDHTVFRCHIIDSITASGHVKSPQHKLVFMCMSNTLSTETLAQLLKTYQGTPIIGVLEPDSLPHTPLFSEFIWHYISVPFSQQDILLNASKYLNKNAACHRATAYDNAKSRYGFELLKGTSQAMLEVKKKICKIAPYDTNTLLIGETGSGKELTARMIHFYSDRAKGPFVPINCGAIPIELFENELFGHTQGAYTHATQNQIGLIQHANKGILFLDEVEALPLQVQAKLLRFLEEKKYRKLGSPHALDVDVRVIAAAKENIYQMQEQGHFRTDLFYRLSVTHISIPPLRERREDVPELVNHFLKRYAALYNKKFKGISPAAMLHLIHSTWEGNVRELENVIQSAIIESDSDWLEVGDIQTQLKNKPMHASGAMPALREPASLKAAKERFISSFERQYLRNVLQMFNGNVTRAAEYAQKERSSFCRLLRKYNIKPNAFREQMA